MRKRFAAITVLAAAAVAVSAALAQDGADRSQFVRFLERLLSTPERQVALSGLEGVFSANPRIESITVSDTAGPWLEIEGVAVTWSRSALLQRTLDIDNLSARRVSILRRPAPAAPASSDDAGGFSAPPLTVSLDSFAFPEIVVAPALAGAEAHLTASGSAQLTREALSAQLSVDRQDRAGLLVADLRFEPGENVLTANLRLEEPSGGLLAEVLNLRHRPSLAVSLSGTGPLDDWRAELAAEANGASVLEGNAAIARTPDGHRLTADAVAQLESVAPAEYAGLVADRSNLAIDVTRGSDGALVLQAVTLRSGGIDLDASGRLTPDLVPESAELTLRLGQAGRAALPFAPGEVSVAGLEATAGLDSGAAAPWTLDISAEGVESAYGRVARMALTARGNAHRLDSPADRSTSFRFDGSLDGVALTDPALREAVGPTLQLSGGGSWSSGLPLAIDTLQMVLTGATAGFAGMVTGEGLVGNFEASLTDLSRLDGIAARPLAGRGSLRASGKVGFSGVLDLRVEGETTDLALGVSALDPLFASVTRIEGGVARVGETVTFDALQLASEHATLALKGSLAEALDLSASATVADLSRVTPDAAGAARVEATLSGTRDAPHVEAEMAGENVVLMGRPLSNGTARFAGTIAGPETSGSLEIAGSLAGAPVEGTAQLAAGEGGARRIEGLRLSVGESHLAGNLTIAQDGLLAGDLEIVSPDLADVAPLFLVEARGMLRANVSLAATDGMQSATITGTATDLAYETVTLDSADIDGEARNLFAAPELGGTFAIRNLRTGGLVVVRADGRAEREGDTTLVDVDAELDNGRAQATGTLTPQAGGLAVNIRQLLFSRQGIDLALAAPTTIAVRDGMVSFDSFHLNAGRGSAIVTGQAGRDLDLDVELNGIPAELANSFQPMLGAEGSVSGTLFVSGTAAAPSAEFNIALANASVAATRNAGLGPLQIAAQGSIADGSLRIANRITGEGGLGVQVAGTVGASEGGPLDLKVTGTVPLALGNRQLAERGAALEGSLDIDVTVSGTTSAPQFAGRVSSEGGGFVDPETGFVLRDLSLAASLAGNRLAVDRLTARSGEGTVAATGSVGLDPNAGFPVDVALEVRQGRYVDGTLVAAQFDADLALTGSLAAGPVLQGSVVLDRTEITVPERLPRDSVAVDVAHVAPPPPVEQTLAAARQPDRRSGGSSSNAGITLDVTINAPRQIFVRGRGLDTELGGDLRLTGSVSALVASGAFEMVRGRLDILTQRIAFDRGIVTFAGDLDPILDFNGTTQSGDVAITVSVAGRASDPEVIFSSIPELPQDEVLARLIFQKGIGELSPLQIGRLAAAAAELSGGSGGLLSQLRQTTGLDDLDIVLDEEGAPSLAAGRYVSENVYVGVQQGTTAESSRVTIDLDVTKDIKARAGVSPSGGSSLGVFFEREY